MKFDPKKIKNIFRVFNEKRNASQKINKVTTSTRKIFSEYLDREVTILLFLPPDFTSTTTDYPVLFFHDGQDLQKMNFQEQLETAYQNKDLDFHIVVGIVAGDRLEEYGTGPIEDYARRGNRSVQHNSFVLKELLPLMQGEFRASKKTYTHTVAGFSLGGLAAIYLAWKNPSIFRCVGVFSGSLWWRSMAFNEQYPDANLIIHRIIETSIKRPNLSLWFQAGTKDETSDRNGNGVIDAIDDTLSLISILKKLGYKEDEIKYLEIQDGRHEPATWAIAMPDFLRWIGINKIENK